MREKSDLFFIDHILDSIHSIEDFSRGLTKKQFVSHRLRQSAIVREIEIIGEAVKNVSNSLKEKHTEISWRNIAGTRDKMIHHYFGVDLDIVFAIIRNDLPILKEQVLKIKRELV